MGQKNSTKKLYSEMHSDIDNILAAYLIVSRDNVMMKKKLQDITGAIQREDKQRVDNRQDKQREGKYPYTYDDPVDEAFEKSLPTIDAKREELHKFRVYLNHNIDTILDSEEFTEELCFAEMLCALGVNYCKATVEKPINPPEYTPK